MNAFEQGLEPERGGQLFNSLRVAENVAATIGTLRQGLSNRNFSDVLQKVTSLHEVLTSRSDKLKQGTNSLMMERANTPSGKKIFNFLERTVGLTPEKAIDIYNNGITGVSRIVEKSTHIPAPVLEGLFHGAQGLELRFNKLLFRWKTNE